MSHTHPPGEPTIATTIERLTAKGLTPQRFRDVLDDLSVVEGRTDSLRIWANDQISGLPEQIRAGVDIWIEVLRLGGHRWRLKARRTADPAALRDLFRLLNKQRMVFANPTPRH